MAPAYIFSLLRFCFLTLFKFHFQINHWKFFLIPIYLRALSDTEEFERKNIENF